MTAHPRCVSWQRRSRCSSCVAAAADPELAKQHCSKEHERQETRKAKYTKGKLSHLPLTLLSRLAPSRRMKEKLRPEVSARRRSRKLACIAPLFASCFRAASWPAAAGGTATLSMASGCILAGDAFAGFGTAGGGLRGREAAALAAAATALAWAVRSAVIAAKSGLRRGSSSSEPMARSAIVVLGTERPIHMASNTCLVKPAMLACACRAR